MGARSRAGGVLGTPRGRMVLTTWQLKKPSSLAAVGWSCLPGNSSLPVLLPPAQGKQMGHAEGLGSAGKAAPCEYPSPCQTQPPPHLVPSAQPCPLPLGFFQQGKQTPWSCTERPECGGFWRGLRLARDSALPGCSLQLPTHRVTASFPSRGGCGVPVAGCCSCGNREASHTGSLVPAAETTHTAPSTSPVGQSCLALQCCPSSDNSICSGASRKLPLSLNPACPCP